MVNYNKKIIIVTSGLLNTSNNTITIGGVQTYIQDLYIALKDKGCEVLITEISSISLQKYRTTINGFNISIYPKYRYYRSKEQKVFENIYKEYNSLETIFIISTDQMDIKSKATNVIQIQHGVAFDIPGYMISGFWGRYKILQRINKFLRCIKNTQRLYHTKNTVCVDYNFYNWFRTLGTIYDGYRIGVIPNYSSSFISKEQLYNKISNNDEIIKIIFARRFVEHRGTLLFIECTNKLLSKYKNIQITFAGTGPLLSIIKKSFEKEKRVVITTFLPSESINIHYNHDIAVIPTIFSEGTSLSACEAMASGCIPVSTYVGGLSNIIINGYNGILANPNTTDFYNAIEQVITMSKEDKQEMIIEAYKTAVKSFSHTRWAKQWCDFIGI